jgi:hypothetical protein
MSQIEIQRRPTDPEADYTDKLPDFFHTHLLYVLFQGNKSLNTFLTAQVLPERSAPDATYFLDSARKYAKN